MAPYMTAQDLAAEKKAMDNFQRELDKLFEELGFDRKAFQREVDEIIGYKGV